MKQILCVPAGSKSRRFCGLSWNSEVTEVIKHGKKLFGAQKAVATRKAAATKSYFVLTFKELFGNAEQEHAVHEY